MQELINNQFQGNKIDDYFYHVIEVAFKNKDLYAKNIEENLFNWHYDRLGYIEKSILLLGYAEKEIAEIKESVIIDEAIEIAKEYADDDAYKLINSILDKDE